MNTYKGQKVYIKDLDQFGIVQTEREGRIETVRIQTPEGERIVNVFNKAVQIVQMLHQSGFLDLLVQLFRSIFKRQ